MRHATRLTALFLLLALVLIGLRQDVMAQSWHVLGQHVVQAKESLFCIGRAYGVDPWAIAKQNHILNVGIIHRGNVLQIPDAPAALPPGPVCPAQFTPRPSCGQCTCRYQHLVSTGDSMVRIALRYGVDMWTLAQCNCIDNLNYIQVGTTLCVP